jgi:hypothetical protein
MAVDLSPVISWLADHAGDGIVAALSSVLVNRLLQKKT